MGWSGFGAVTILVTKRRFWPFGERRDCLNLLIPLCPGRDSHPPEGNPHRILSPFSHWVKSNEIPIDLLPYLPLNPSYRVNSNESYQVSGGTIMGRHFFVGDKG